MVGDRENLREEARELNSRLKSYDEETLNAVITAAYKEGNVEEAEEILRSAYGLYNDVSGLAQEGVAVSNNEVDKEFEEDEFPFEWMSLSEFHRNYEDALMRYVGIIERVDDARYDSLEDMMQDEEVNFPDWVDYEDIEGSEVID
jgi:hypothetical protein